MNPAAAQRVQTFVLATIAEPAFSDTVAEIESRSGVKAWLVSSPQVPMVAVRFSFEGGASQDPVDQEGIASLLADIVAEGPAGLKGRAFHASIAELGARFSLSATRDAIHGSIECLTTRLLPAAELLGKVLAAPALAPTDLERIKSQRLASLKEDATDPTTVATRQWYALAYGNRPYGRPIQGQSKAIST